MGQQGEATKEAITEVAQGVVLDKGLSGMSIDEIRGVRPYVRLLGLASIAIVTACGTEPGTQRGDAGSRDASNLFDGGPRPDVGFGVDTGPTDTGPTDTGPTGAPANMEGLMAITNAARAQSGSGPMTWHQGLADTAASWAANCQWMHAPDNVRRYQGQILGENLSAGSGENWTPTELGQGWIDEIAFYDCAANSCAPGEMCGHYTQVIWRDSTEVGCAIQTCNSGNPFGSGNWTFLVCRYAPAGNFVGRRPIPVTDCP